jgi:ribosomal protein L11 methyltransferase
VQQEFVVIVDEECVDALSDALLDAGALSVAVEDADADLDTEQPLFGEPGLEPARPGWRSNRLVVMLDADADAQALLATAAAALDRAAPAIVAAREVGEADWVRLTQAQFTPTRISDRLWIVPTWHNPPDPGAINIRLDPGVAFGTGTHPTTRLCLAWLAQAELANARVLDYGCGSGILAIAAAKLGAREVVGTDIDPQALQAARANSAINRAAARYTDPQEIGADRFDVILANILANPLSILAPALVARLAAGGHLVLSGILDRQAPQVIDTYARLDRDLAFAVWRSEDGWTCIVGARAPAR